ncbi:MAG: methyltransferase domain-containing protein [Nitrospinae bacterium]|nr:methyltransferase domain-containing protein [Nitrospinota bacterium]
MSQKRWRVESGELGYEELLALSWGWRPSLLLLEASRAGVFDAAAGGWRTGDEIAAALGANPRAVELLLFGLAGAGLMKKSGARYRNTDAIERHFVRASPEYRGAILDLDRRAVNNWGHIGEVLASGRPIPKPEQTEEEKRAWQETFIRAMDALARLHVEEVVGALPQAGGMRLLDIGCGPATYLIEWLRRVPDGRAVAFDRPASGDTVLRLARTAGVGDRVEFMGGDFTLDTFKHGGPFDVTLVSQVLHILGADGARELLKRAAAATRPGGVVAVHEMALGPDEHPGAAGIFAVQMMLGTAEGCVFTDAELRALLADAGLTVEDARPTDNRSRIYLGRKPV